LLGGAFFITRLESGIDVWYVTQSQLNALAETDRIDFGEQIYFLIGSWKSYFTTDGKYYRIDYKGVEFRSLAGTIYFVSEAWYSDYLSRKFAEEEQRMYSAANIERAARAFGFTIAEFKRLKNYEQRYYLLQTVEP
jgi:hypothetical protein